MSETYNSKRIKFKRGKQKVFIENCQNKLGLKNNKMASLLRVSVRTITDWRREKYSIPQKTAVSLSQKAKISLPKDIKILEQYWYTIKGAKISGKLVYQKYGVVGGDPRYRLKKWREWWDKKGRFTDNPLLKAKEIKKPQKTESLAEFVGIMMGDGGISPAQVIVSLNSKTDLNYSHFVVKLIQKLFGVKPNVNFHKKFLVLRVTVSRVELVKFCKKIGLHIGDKLKQGLDMPAWIKKNKKFKNACLRGLFDTDGYVAIHKYMVNSKLYTYKKYNFSSASPTLIISAFAALKELNFKPRISKSGRNIWLDNQEEVKRYFKIIGTSNPKHQERFLR